jgi:hypothetical protein
MEFPVTEQPVEYVAARRTLLDALDALISHQESLVLIGAQAIYMHTSEMTWTVPPMTTDADLALDADILGDDPEIAATLQEAGFTPGQPGHWESSQGIAVDLMVAPHQSNRSSSTARSARLGPHAKTVARIGPGLAPALADNSLHVVAALDASDSRRHEIRVAGPAALLVAKSIKIDDRLSEADRGHPERIVDKDALDILRLLQATSIETLRTGLTRHAAGSPAQMDVERGLGVLRQRAKDANDEIPSLAMRAAGDDPTVAPSVVALVRELIAALT